jgi:predicted metal-binding membrane protein
MVDIAQASDRQPTALEEALAHPRLPLIVLLILFPLVCWIWIIVLARDMYGPMNGASAWMMTMAWDARHIMLLWAMWAVMMAGMMLPSAAPTLLLYGAAARRNAAASGIGQIYAMAGGYLLVWALFSVAATALQRILATQLLLTPMMETGSAVGAGLLVIAGIYQLTPLKAICVSTCQSPLGFLMRHWRRGTAGALRMGIQHGAYCVGCCWALMLLLFAGGVMNLGVIAALTAFVAFEKLTPYGVQGARVSGALLIASGVWMFSR